MVQKYQKSASAIENATQKKGAIAKPQLPLVKMEKTHNSLLKLSSQKPLSLVLD